MSADQKFTPGADPRQAIAGPHTALDNENPDKGFPLLQGLLYMLPPSVQGGPTVSRPFLLTSSDPRNQHCTGYVFIEPGDNRPSRAEGPGAVMILVRDVPMSGTAGQPDTVHWAPKWYTGRSDGPGLTPVDSVEQTAEVPAGSNAAPLPVTAKPADQVAEEEEVFAPADKNKDGVISHKEAKDFKNKHQG